MVTKQVKRAMEYIQVYFPQVVIYILNINGQWCFMDEDFNAPDFSNIENINQSILEEASDSIADLPYIYQDFHE